MQCLTQALLCSLLCSLATGAPDRAWLLSHNAGHVTQLKPPEGVATVEHEKTKSNGYVEGSPLYEKQEALKKDPNAKVAPVDFPSTPMKGLPVGGADSADSAELKEGYYRFDRPPVEVPFEPIMDTRIHNKTCGWWSLALVLACCCLGSPVSLRSQDAHSTRNKKASMGLTGLAFAVGAAVFIYIMFFTSVYRDFLKGHPVGIWCFLLCVWASLIMCASVCSCGMLFQSYSSSQALDTSSRLSLPRSSNAGNMDV